MYMYSVCQMLHKGQHHGLYRLQKNLQKNVIQAERMGWPCSSEGEVLNVFRILIGIHCNAGSFITKKDISEQ
jgi:hypothetical protein